MDEGFKHSFKYYKSRNPPPSLLEVFDLHIENKSNSKINRVNPDLNDRTIFGLKPIQDWEVYQFVDKKGLFYIKNPFSSIGQRYWIVRCLQDYTKKPNKLNIDAHNLVPQKRNWWDLCKSHNTKWVEKLRWATLGYHHNWDTKVYCEESRDEFPSDLALLCKYLADSLRFSNFIAEAAIVNFYHMDSTLSGHTDHSEQNLNAPLFSLSFGQSAIFLIGGKTLQEKPLAIMLHSGDILVMSEEARLCYHGVPKIVKNEEKPWEINECKENLTGDIFDYEIAVKCRENEFFKPFSNYVERSRINLNVRQVLNCNQKFLE